MGPVVAGHVERRFPGINEGVAPFQSFRGQDGEFGRGVGPLEGEGERTASLRRGNDGLAVDHLGGPFLREGSVERTHQAVAFTKLKFQRPDQHPDLKSYACPHTHAPDVQGPGASVRGLSLCLCTLLTDGMAARLRRVAASLPASPSCSLSARTSIRTSSRTRALTLIGAVLVLLRAWRHLGLCRPRGYAKRPYQHENQHLRPPGREGARGGMGPSRPTAAGVWYDEGTSSPKINIRRIKRI